MKAIELSTPDGRTILVEIDEGVEEIPAEAPDGRVAGGSAQVVKNIARLEEVGAVVADLCRTLSVATMEALGAVKPDEMTLEFGVKFAGEGGVPCLTKVSGEATLKVTAKWDWKGGK
jgi:hypothetical protein